MRIAGAAAVAAVALVLLFANVLRHPQYTPDGIVYARFAARDAGRPEREATLQARAFYERTAMMQNPRYRDLIELDPSVSFARSKVFENRVLYPWAVAALLPLAGFKALFIVSAVSYVAFGLALYWALLAVGRPVFAAAFAVIALALPLTRSIAASDLTDMLAMVWWTFALGALLYWMRREGTRGMMTVLLIAGALLALTRPTPYLIVIPATTAAVLRRSWLPFAASLGSVLAFAAAAVATHAFGVSEQLRWVYGHRPARGGNATFQSWYRSSLWATVRAAIVSGVKSIAIPVLFFSAIWAAARGRLRDEFIVLIAAGVACCIAIPFNPVESALARVIALPLIPVLCAIAQALAAVYLPEPHLAADPRLDRRSAPVR